jgi:hypothetical protein
VTSLRFSLSQLRNISVTKVNDQILELFFENSIDWSVRAQEVSVGQENQPFNFNQDASSV